MCKFIWANYLQQLLEASVLLLVLEALLAPLGDGGAVEDDHVEVGVQDQDGVGLDGGHVQQHGSQGRFQRVGHEGRLDGQQSLGCWLLIEHQAAVGRLVRAVAKNLHTKTYGYWGEPDIEVEEFCLCCTGILSFVSCTGFSATCALSNDMFLTVRSSKFNMAKKARERHFDMRSEFGHIISSFAGCHGQIKTPGRMGSAGG